MKTNQDCTESGRRHNSLRTFDVNVVHIFHTKPAISRTVCMSKNLARSICFMANICPIGMQNYIFAFSELEKNIVLQPSSFQDLGRSVHPISVLSRFSCLYF